MFVDDVAEQGLWALGEVGSGNTALRYSDVSHPDRFWPLLRS